VDFEGNLEQTLLRQLIDHSYNLVVKGLKKSLRAELEAM
jgi:predicted DNA-binding protein (MmcQ/YjbR family)